MAGFHLQYFINFILILLVIEIFTIVLLLISIMIRRISSTYKDAANIAEERRISDLILEYIKGNEFSLDCFISKKEILPVTLLMVMEKYNHRLSSPEWNELKKALSSRYLLPIARRLWGSSRWLEKNFSARCFTMCATSDDRDMILSLMDDPHFLVQSIAAVAALKLPLKAGVIKLIQLMKNETGYAYSIYRDLLIKNRSPEIFEWIVEYAAEEKEETAHLVCLDILSTETTSIKHPFLHSDLNSKNICIYRAAVKLFANNPQIDSQNILLKSIDDPDEEVRTEAAYGLRYFLADDSLKKLKKALNDSYWRVRLTAALSLKSMGKSGITILEQQKVSDGENPYEVAQYALRFD